MGIVQTPCSGGWFGWKFQVHQPLARLGAKLFLTLVEVSSVELADQSLTLLSIHSALKDTLKRIFLGKNGGIHRVFFDEDPTAFKDGSEMFQGASALNNPHRRKI